MSDIRLTPAQEQALDISQNTLVEAGAGSGKTFVFVQRFLRILQENPRLDPSHIVAITFTHLAAAELKERLHQELVRTNLPTHEKMRMMKLLNHIQISTIHGFCSRLIRRYPLELGIDPYFITLDEEGAQGLLKECIADTLSQRAIHRCPSLRRLLDFFSLNTIQNWLFQCVSQLQWALKHFKKDTIEKNSFEAALKDLFLDAYESYQKRKISLGALDFNDLLLFVTRLTQHPYCLEELQETLQYILVDEFQDTDPEQWAFIQALCDSRHPLTKNKLFLVGDIKQSIYSFRGADAPSFLRTLDEFEASLHSQVVHLADNFRSNSGLLNILNPVFQHVFENTTEDIIPYTPLNAHKVNEGHMDIAFLDNCKTLRSEAKYIASWIISHKSKHPHLAYSDFAVLVRRRALFSHLEHVFEAAHIPLQFDQPAGFYQLDLVHDLASILICLVDPMTRTHWVRVLTSPLFNISETDIFSLTQSNDKKDLWTAIKKDTSETFHHIKIQFSKWFSLQKSLPLSELAQRICVDTQAWSIYRGGPEKAVAEPALTSILLLIKDLESATHGHTFTLISRLENLLGSEKSPSHYSPDLGTEGINVMTIHASKGLEFPVVVVAECHQSFFIPKSDTLLLSSHGLAIKHPHKEASDARKQTLKTMELEAIEESKRVFYVACTRAKEHLLLTGRQSLENHLDSEKRHSFFDLLHPLLTPDKNSPINILTQTDKQNPNSKMTLPLNKNNLAAASQKEKEAPQIHIPNKIKPLHRYSVSSVETFLQCPKKYHLMALVTHLPVLTDSEDHYGPRIGSITHLVIEQANRHPDLPTSHILEQFKSELNEEDTRFVLDQVNRYKKSDIFPDCSSIQAQHEGAFSLKFGQSLIEGRYDTLIHGSEIRIVDYKTDALGDADPDDYSTSYYYQMKLYALAAFEQFRPNAVTCLLYYTRTGTAVSFSFSSKTLIAFKQQLQTESCHYDPKKFRPPAKKTCLDCPYFSKNTQCPTH